MTPDEKRAYLEHTYRTAPPGSARRIWAAAQLAAGYGVSLQTQRTVRRLDPSDLPDTPDNRSYHHTRRSTSREA